MHIARNAQMQGIDGNDAMMLVGLGSLQSKTRHLYC